MLPKDLLTTLIPFQINESPLRSIQSSNSSAHPTFPIKTPKSIGLSLSPVLDVHPSIYHQFISPFTSDHHYIYRHNCIYTSSYPAHDLIPVLMLFFMFLYPQPGDFRAVLGLKIGALVAPNHPWAGYLILPHHTFSIIRCILAMFVCSLEV